MKIIKIAAKILGYLLGGVIGLVVVLLVAVNFLLQSSAFTGFVMGKVLPLVGQSLGARIEARGLTLSILPFHLRLHGVIFTPAEGDFRMNFAELDTLEVDVATSTYQTVGLPPGPIVSPGLDAIKAALSPQATPFWFFLSDKTRRSCLRQ